jgi:hypothetical protein
MSRKRPAAYFESSDPQPTFKSHPQPTFKCDPQPTFKCHPK